MINLLTILAACGDKDTTSTDTAEEAISDDMTQQSSDIYDFLQDYSAYQEYTAYNVDTTSTTVSKMVGYDLNNFAAATIDTDNLYGGSTTYDSPKYTNAGVEVTTYSANPLTRNSVNVYVKQTLTVGNSESEKVSYPGIEENPEAMLTGSAYLMIRTISDSGEEICYPASPVREVSEELADLSDWFVGMSELTDQEALSKSDLGVPLELPRENNEIAESYYRNIAGAFQGDEYVEGISNYKQEYAALAQSIDYSPYIHVANIPTSFFNEEDVCISFHESDGSILGATYFNQAPFQLDQIINSVKRRNVPKFELSMAHDLFNQQNVYYALCDSFGNALTLPAYEETSHYSDWDAAGHTMTDLSDKFCGTAYSLDNLFMSAITLEFEVVK